MKYISSVFLLSLCLLLSCNYFHHVKYSHPEYFDSVFENASKINDQHPEQALTYIDRAYRSFPEPGLIDLYRKYDYKATYYCQMGTENAVATAYIDSMISLTIGKKDEPKIEELYSKALFRKGDIYIWKKDYINAFDCYFKARQILEKKADSCLLGSYTSILSMISFKQGKYLDAARYNIESLNEVSKCNGDYNNFRIVEGDYDNIGIAYGLCGMLDSAMYYYNKALNYLDEHKGQFADHPDHPLYQEIARGIVYGNMGDVYLKKGDTLTGEDCYKKGFALNGMAGHDHGDAQCTGLKLISLHLIRGEYNDAQVLLDRIKSSLDSFSDKDNRLKWYKLQLDYLDKTGQQNKMYSFIKPYLHLKDSLVSIKQMPQFDLQKEYEHVREKYELADLERDNKLKNKFLILEFVSVLIMIVTAILLSHQWKKSRQLNTKISKQNDQLQFALSSLTESQKENTQMMQIVAHDLKNPIASMISITSLLLDSPDLPADDREMLELMQKSSMHAIDMVSDILNINTTSEGMKKEPVEINVLLRYCVDLLQFQADAKHQHIYLDTENVTVQINQEKIWRVVSNLIVNAIKFSEEGKSIEVSGRKHDNELWIEVKDYGIGIPDKIKFRIFEMFSNARRPGTSGERSFGMGMAISRQIVEAHGGRIWFESVEGQGTSFFISLPLTS